MTTFTAGARSPLPPGSSARCGLGSSSPEVNVVVAAVLLLTVIPVAVAARLTGGGGVTRASTAAPHRERIARGARGLAADSGAVEPPGL